MHVSLASHAEVLRVKALPRVLPKQRRRDESKKFIKIRVEGTVEGSSFASLLVPRVLSSFHIRKLQKQFFSQYRSHATMLMPTGLPVVTLGPF